MKWNQNGFSLIELLAVLVLSSVALVPLLLSFTNTIVENQKAIQSRLGASVVEGALYAIEKIDFATYRNAIDAAYVGGNNYLELNADTCATVFTVDPTDEAVCDSVFAMEVSGVTYTSSEFQIYMFDYSLTTLEHNALVNDVTLPQEARNEINTNQDILDARDGTDVQNLVWMIIWVDYFDNPDQYLITSGIFANDDPEFYE